MKFKRISAFILPGIMAMQAVPMLANAQSFEITELPTTELSENQFASSIDNTGLMLNLVRNRFNQPIDLSLIDLSQIFLTDPDAAEQGDFNAVDLAILTSLIYELSSANATVGQKLAAQVGYQTNGVDYEYIFGFDTVQENTNGYTYSMNTTLGDSVYGTFIVGTMQGPFSTVEYINEDAEEITYNVNEFLLRGFVQVGDKVGHLTPFNDTLGGYSVGNAINENLQVAGETTVEVSDALQTLIDTCADFDLRGDIPLEVCNYNLINSNLLSGMSRRAAIWQVDNDGEVLSTEVYGLTFEPDEDVSLSLSNQALDINNLGQAVGYTQVQLNFTSSYPQAAAIFENGETRRLLIDDDLLPNRAVSINDDGIVVGYIESVFNNAVREKLFVYNVRSDELTQPIGFFDSSATIPTAVNNNGIVVGTAEANTDDRRYNGFMYDINARSFYNLNDLTPCDSEYEIIAANDINDSNEIIADALVKRPSRNELGEEQTDLSGEVIYTDVVLAVKLTATGGETPDCDISEEELAETERQGAGVNLFFLFGLAFIAITRQKFLFKLRRR